MLIGKLDEHCGNCKLIDYCTEPYCTPQICTTGELEDVEEDTYLEIAQSVTEAEISEKIVQYKDNNVSPWDDERNGAILDIVLEKLIRG